MKNEIKYFVKILLKKKKPKDMLQLRNRMIQQHIYLVKFYKKLLLTFLFQLY